MSFYYDIVAPHEAEEILNYTIDGGESLLLYGADDFGQILSWINLADLSLELIPSCRESLNSCLDWDGTNRERVEVALSILRDARQKLHDPFYTTLRNPSDAYWMLIERVCGRKRASSGLRHSTRPAGLSYRDSSLEEQP